MRFPYHIVIIIPDAIKPLAENFGSQLGHSGREYNIPLSADGSWPPTHWGVSTIAQPAFVSLLQGNAPVPAMQAALDALLSVSIVSIRPHVVGEYRQHFADVLALHGLQKAQPPENEE